MCVLATQSYLTLCDPIDCSPPDSSVHRILQARILEWVAIPSQPRDRTQVSCIAGRFFTVWATKESPNNIKENYKRIIIKAKEFSKNKSKTINKTAIRTSWSNC